MASDVDDKKGFSTITARPFQEQGVARDDRCRSTQIADKKKPLLLAAFFNVWLHDLDSNQGPND